VGGQLLGVDRGDRRKGISAPFPNFTVGKCSENLDGKFPSKNAIFGVK